MHAGFIYNRIEKSENGGIRELQWIRDTTVDAREIEVYLKNASNALKKNTVFIDQSYRIPLSFLDKDVRARKKEEKRKAFVRDSIMASGDSIAIEAFLAQEEAEAAVAASETEGDTLKTDITTAFIGHSSEYSVIRKTYTDEISEMTHGPGNSSMTDSISTLREATTR